MLFIEVSNTDEQFLNENYRANVLCSPDYAGKGTTESAFLDYRRRVDNYSTVFEPIDERQDHPVRVRACVCVRVRQPVAVSLLLVSCQYLQSLAVGLHMCITFPLSLQLSPLTNSNLSQFATT